MLSSVNSLAVACTICATNEELVLHDVGIVLSLLQVSQSTSNLQEKRLVRCVLAIQGNLFVIAKRCVLFEYTRHAAVPLHRQVMRQSLRTCAGCFAFCAPPLSFDRSGMAQLTFHLGYVRRMGEQVSCVAAVAAVPVRFKSTTS